SPERKWQILGDAFRTAKLLHAAGYRQRNPHATAADIHRDWLRVQYGFTGQVEGEPLMDPAIQNVQILREILAVFDKLAIPYALGGSMASSVHGVARYTRNADLCVEPFPGKEAALVTSLGPDYYLSLPAVQQA